VTDVETLRSVVTPTAGGCAIALVVTSRASRAGLDGVAADGVRLLVAAPPVDGAANVAVVRFLAGVLDVPPSRVRLIAGERGRRKRVAIAGMAASDAVARLSRRLQDRDRSR
jgi:uncharacterized protein